MTESLSATQALALVDNCPLPLLVVDKQGRVTAYNRAFEQLVAPVPAAGLLGHAFATPSGHPLHALLDQGQSIRWTDHSDKEVHFEVQCVDLPDGEQARFFVDVSRQVELEQAQHALNAQLEEHILTDALTGLLNQRGVMLALEPQVARSRRYNSPMSVIMLDMHSLQDQDGMLLKAAQLLKDQLRWADLIGCTEDREFIVVLPETQPDPALQLAEKLTQRLQQLDRESLAGRQPAVCYGVTAWRRSDNAGTLLRRAGVALSQARSGQGDRSIAL